MKRLVNNGILLTVLFAFSSYSQIRVNCGSADWTAAGWVNDASYIVSGTQRVNPEKSRGQKPINTGTNPLAAPYEVYKTDRFGSTVEFTIPVASGDYIIRLHFVDLDADRADDFMNISINGNMVLNNFLINQNTSNVNEAVVVEISQTVSESSITIVLNALNDEALCAGFEIIPDINLPPVPDAGQDQSGSERSEVMLDGSGSYDPNGDPITFNWEQIDNVYIPLIVTLDDPTSITPRFTAPAVNEPVALKFRCEVSDGLFAVSDTVLVTVNGGFDTQDFLYREFYGTAGSLPYRLYIPQYYDGSTPIACMLWLHGAGGRGSNNTSQIENYTGSQVWAYPEHQADHPALVIAPQCPSGEQWSNMCNDFYDPTHSQETDSLNPPSGPGDCWNVGAHWQVKELWTMATVNELVSAMIEEFEIDANRIYVSGQSMGGYGAWDAAARYPHRFAAVIPAAGGGAPHMNSVFKQMGVWAFHGDADNTVPIEGSQDVVDAILSAGGLPRFTVYPGEGHSIWDTCWNDPLLNEWTFAHKKVPLNTPPAAVTDLNGTANGTTIILSWSPVSDGEGDIASYHLYRSDDGGTEYWATGFVNDPPFSDNGLAEFTTYHYYILAVDHAGAVSSAGNVVTVTSGSGVPNQAPQSHFAWAASGLMVNFTDESTDSDGEIAGWEWNFGDGSSPEYLQNPSYTYNQDGTYAVRLKVTDDDGATDTYEEEISVVDCATPLLTIQKVKITGKYVPELTWTCALGQNVHIYKNGVFLTATVNDGLFIDDSVPRKFSGTIVYSVCDAEATGECSAEVAVVF